MNFNNKDYIIGIATIGGIQTLCRMQRNRSVAKSGKLGSSFESGNNQQCRLYLL